MKSRHINFATVKALDVIDSVSAFYESCSRKFSLNLDDILVIAYVNGNIGGLVRLCLEHQTYVLRTMQVKEELQSQGIGRAILEKFEELLLEKGIQKTYCIPYSHLEKFYSTIGFRKIESSEAPEFLQNRLDEFKSINPNKSFILMFKED